MRSFFLYSKSRASKVEAALWSKIFTLAEEKFGLDIGTIKATVLIETLLMAFQMDENSMGAKRTYRWIKLWEMGLHF